MHVICIGASAGGLDPLKTFFANVNDMPCCAYVVITHLEASHPSMLPELIQRHASLPVQQITGGMRLARDNVYIIPPDKEVTLADDHFQLSKRQRDGFAQPINAFMLSLAKTKKSRAIAIILSGMGSDGTHGIRAIKQEYGMVIAQDPATTQFDAMPKSAIDTGLVDSILKPADMPRRIASYITQQKVIPPDTAPALDRATSEAFKAILHLLRTASGTDFSNYKTGTLLRRIQRRMAIHQFDAMAAYVRYLQENPKEVGVLYKEMLIGVTSFFRDPEAWVVIQENVLPLLLDDKPKAYTVRIWVPGAATGEEAYTIAMVFHEYIQDHQLDLTIQIFATDLNEDAVEAARVGLYPSSIAEDMSDERLQRYFMRENNHYRIKREIREMVIFARQNLVKDPPFTKLDYICCRNLLIYLDSDLQRKVLPLFHYALRPGGILVLGSSETVGDFAELFETIDSRWKIYRRREASQPLPRVEFSLHHPDIPKPKAKKDQPLPPLTRVAELCLLREFAPPAVVARSDGEIVYIHGRTGKYLEPAQGHARLNVLEMAREGFRAQLPDLLRRAWIKHGEAVSEQVRIKTNGGTEEVTICLKAIGDHNALMDMVLISFIEPVQGPQRRPRRAAKGADKYVAELESELADIRKNLQSSIEARDTSSEELRSVNEEYQSTNEELRSANEELETSREEMQSLNEELATVNAELQDKVESLMQAHQDMQGFLDSLDSPTLFLDSELRIKRFTSQARRVINIMDQDVGRPLSHLATHLKNVNLLEDTQQVNESLRPVEKVVQTHGGHYYIMRVLPSHPDYNEVQGIVLNFVDVQDFKHLFTDDTAPRPRELTAAVMDAIREPVILLEEDLTVILANAAFYATFNTSESAMIGRRLNQLGDGDWEIMRRKLEEALTQEKRVENLELTHTSGKLERKRLILNGRTIQDGARKMIVLSIRDVTRESV